jgi:hypothetical protein
MSRHTGEAHLVVSDAAERKAIVQRQMLGAEQRPSQEDVVRNIAANLSRFAAKRYATTMIERAISVQRGTVRSYLAGAEAVQRTAPRQGEINVSGYEMSRLAQRLRQRTVDIAHQVQQRLRQQLGRGQEREM